MKRALLWGIQFYRSAVSPYKGGPRCRYTPTCSQYAQTAIERYGAVKGARLAAWRVLRCNPFILSAFFVFTIPQFVLL